MPQWTASPLALAVVGAVLLWIGAWIGANRDRLWKRRDQAEAESAAVRVKQIDVEVTSQQLLWHRIEKLEGQVSILSEQNLTLSREAGANGARINALEQDKAEALAREKEKDRQIHAAYDYIRLLEAELRRNNLPIPEPKRAGDGLLGLMEASA